MSGTIAIVANPMSGRDVRRLAARATNMTHEAKRDLVARVAAGADAAGVDRILIMKEPFQVSTGALERMPLRAEVEILEPGVTNSAADTVNMVKLCRDAGCDTMVTLGGDGTNRIVARTWPDVPIVPLSTGTNNVFPVLVEATSAGLAAGLVAAGVLAIADVGQRCKLLHIDCDGTRDVGVIDAVLLRRDHIGNFLPFDPERLADVVLTRAEPDAVGMSPIGGLLDPVYASDDFGLALKCGDEVAPGDVTDLSVPVSPGLFRPVRVAPPQRLPLDSPLTLTGPGVIALDGDREHKLASQETATVTLRRDGPPIIDVAKALQTAVAQGYFRKGG